MFAVNHHLKRIGKIGQRVLGGFAIGSAVGDWANGATNNPEDVETVQLLLEKEGDGYPVDVYFLEPRASCTISVRLAAGDEPLAWVRDTGCPHECPLSDAAMDRQ